MSNKCPRCNNELIAINIDDVIIDKCNQCNGIFLDKYELNRLKNIEKINTVLDDTAISTFEDKKDSVRCIRCNTLMKTINFAYSSNIMIDHCNNCDSVWLDGGELTKIIDYLKESYKSFDEKSSSYEELAFKLSMIKDEVNKNAEKNFRAMSSDGKIGLIVNFIYKIINRVTGI